MSVPLGVLRAARGRDWSQRRFSKRILVLLLVTSAIKNRVCVLRCVDRCENYVFQACLICIVCTCARTGIWEDRAL